MRWHTANRRRLRRGPRPVVWDVETFSKAFFKGWDDWLSDENIEFDKPPRDRVLTPFIRVPKVTLSFVPSITRPSSLTSIMGIDENDEPLEPITIKRVPTFRHDAIDPPWDPTRYRKD